MKARWVMDKQPAGYASTVKREGRTGSKKALKREVEMAQGPP
jgi:hypothetical protein